MSGATYKYSIKADSGYKSDQSGGITPERHGVVCAVLDGGLSDNLSLLRSAQDMLDALEAITEFIPNTSASEGGAAKHSANVKAADMVRAAIAKAKGLTQ